MYNKKRKAIFFDIDGHYWASGEGIHESVREALKKVRNHGIRYLLLPGVPGAVCRKNCRMWNWTGLLPVQEVISGFTDRMCTVSLFHRN